MKVIDLRKNRKKALEKAVAELEKGNLIIFPTETVYVLGADATNPKAVKKFLEYKGKRKNKPVSVITADKKMAQKYVRLNKTAQKLYEKYLPGPLTVVSKSKNKVVPEIQAKKKTLAIRIPDYPFILQLIKQLEKPVTASSANTSNQPAPYSLKELKKRTQKNKLKMVAFFLDAGRLKKRLLPSTVVDTKNNKITVLRQGPIQLNQTKIISKSEQQTKKIAGEILKKYKDFLKKGCLVFALEGELGSGKTQFVKGIARFLKIKENVPSPTFILLREYKHQIGMLYHIDCWRMEKQQEFSRLGLQKMIKTGNIICIEWAEKVEKVLKKTAKNNKVRIIKIFLEHKNRNKRIIYENFSNRYVMR